MICILIPFILALALDNFNNSNKFLIFSKCSAELDFEFDVIVDSQMNSNFHVVDFYSLAQFTKLNIFKAVRPESTSINISLGPLFLCVLFSSMVFMYFQRMGTKRG